MTSKQILIIGANSLIAQSISASIVNDTNNQLILVSRDLSDYSASVYDDVVKIEVVDYQAKTIEMAVAKIAQQQHAPIAQVYICHGVLHNETLQPEKRLEDFCAQSFQQVMAINALLPMTWIQKLTPILSGKSPCKVTVFSARVGSISDNRLGGWYSYRASKAALNMMLKTAAVELARRAKNIKLIAFHPGTTDTPLSKPFQKNVPADKLFTSDFVAAQLLNIVENSEIDGQASYLDWQGKTINW
jgi:NAD(P)-dependent dehydrogenase (short-subunit alcohol dehydrogenase family)